MSYRLWSHLYLIHLKACGHLILCYTVTIHVASPLHKNLFLPWTLLLFALLGVVRMITQVYSNVNKAL